MKNLSGIEHELDVVTKKYVDDAAGAKVDKVEGKQLSTNDYTTEEKNKLDGIAENANNYILPKASKDVLGGIIIGKNLSIDENGVLNAAGGSGGSGAIEVSVGTEEPIEDSVLIWVDTNETAEAVSLLNYCGTYDNSVQYSVNDLIMYNNAWYLCHAPVINIAPNMELGFQDPYWHPIGASKDYVDTQILNNKSYIDTQISNHTQTADKIISGTFPSGISCETPTSDAHLANKSYVDSVGNDKISTGGGVLTNIWVGTQEEYDAIESKDATTLYLITG